MSAASLTAATWNMAWQAAGSSAAATMLERLAEHSPDIICLTEAYDDVLLPPGHLITAAPDYGYGLTEGRRKVMLWSPEPWESVDPIGHPDLPPGRYIAGRTATPAGPVTVIGVCIPWRDAHVRTGRRDRQCWEDHLAFLAGLSRVVADLSGPVILIGDFNQRIPQRYTSPHVHTALLAMLGTRFGVATAGLAGPDGRMAIDHIAHTADLAPVSVAALSSTGPAGEQLSDHFGVAAKLVCSRITD